MHTDPTSSTGHTPETVEARIISEIRAEMSRQLLNLQGAADALKLNRSTVSRKLRGDVPLTTLEMLRVCTWLEVPAAEILTRAEVAAKRPAKRRAA